MPSLSLNGPCIVAGGLVAITLFMVMRSYPAPCPAASAPAVPAAALRAPLRSHAALASPSSPYYDLSYALPAWFPYAQGYRLVMETIPGTCNLLWNGGTSAPCAAFGNSRAYEPDPHVREAIASVLHHCSHMDCISLDLGANIGSLTAYMAATGSRVLAVEPQLDLAQAIEKTIALNGWDGRVRVFAGLASMAPSNTRTAHMGQAWRMCGYPEPGASVCEGAKVTEWEAPFFSVREELLRLKHVDLVKVDTDTVDGELLQGIIDEVRSGAVSVTSVICEFTGGTGKMLWDFQQLGYKVYRLNVHLGARLFDSTGRDTLHPFVELDLPPQYEERYFM